MPAIPHGSLLEGADQNRTGARLRSVKTPANQQVSETQVSPPSLWGALKAAVCEEIPCFLARAREATPAIRGTDIGTEGKPYTIEPIESPVPGVEVPAAPDPDACPDFPPEFDPEPERQPEEVPVPA